MEGCIKFTTNCANRGRQIHKESTCICHTFFVCKSLGVILLLLDDEVKEAVYSVNAAYVCTTLFCFLFALRCAVSRMFDWIEEWGERMDTSWIYVEVTLYTHMY